MQTPPGEDIIDLLRLADMEPQSILRDVVAPCRADVAGSIAIAVSDCYVGKIAW